MKYIKLYEASEPRQNIKYVGDNIVETWYLNGTWHRDGGPAVIYYRRDDDSIESEFWYQKGKKHRVGGPAVTYYYRTGQPIREEWYLNGIRHREDEPALIGYAHNGSILDKEWYYEGERVNAASLEEFEAWKYLKSIGLSSFLT